MTIPIETVQVTSARARWRADLLRMDAADKRRIGEVDDSPTALGLRAEAENKEAQATIHLDVADLEEAFSVAKQERDANPGDMKIHQRFERARDELVALRSYWRGISEYLGLARFANTVDHFPEPTDEEVLASHGGAN